MLVFAHRGASATEPENTLSAIQSAIDSNSDGIEFDVYQHGNEFVLIHDRWLHRTTNGQGNLEHISFDELRLLDAGNGQQIPTLAEAISVIGDQCLINIEMKGVKEPQRLLDYVDNARAKNKLEPTRFLFSSFDHHLLRRLKSLNSDLRIGALTASKPLNYSAFAKELDAEYVNADVTFVDEHFVGDAHQRGLKVGVYTVDERADLLMLKKWGVDLVFANHPGNAKAILAG